MVETIVLRSKSTNLEVIARYSKTYPYKLDTGESCYSAVIEYNGLEYVVCISKIYKTIYSVAELLTGLLNYPLAINRVTRLRTGYNMQRDSVCIDAYSAALRNDVTSKSSVFDQFTISEDSPIEIDFDLTERNWNDHNTDK